MRSKTLTGFHAPFIHAVPQVCLKLPTLMDTNLHVCGHEANQNSVTMPGLKLTGFLSGRGAFAPPLGYAENSILHVNQ